ncbi:hypothetical protein AYI69_g861 [Smittium culicis]|uniref:Uncharacterized protein n=1 Tax=Smittium culicis TaxID=133412 RepID=A0A1R1YS00_9FUNG|nr:hypothetical protein AYI69_g861 [Smittium culicis]
MLRHRSPANRRLADSIFPKHYCSTTAPPLLNYCSTAAPLLLHCCSTTAPLLLHYCSTTAPLLLHCCSTTAPLLSTSAVDVLLLTPPISDRIIIVSISRGLINHC